MSEPIPSVAAILVAGDDPCKILLVQRNASLRFMGGYHVFPGGRIDAGESGHRVDAADDEHHAAALHAVVREVFEETGILCTRGSAPDDDRRDRTRRRLIEGEISFDAVLDEFDLRIDAHDFVHAGSWVTPPYFPIRFDTDYYVYACGQPDTASVIEGEISDLGWFTPIAARNAWHVGGLNLPHPVAYALRQIGCHGWPGAHDTMRRTTEGPDGSLGRVEIRRGIHVLPLETSPLPPSTHTNCVIVGEDQLYIIDPGAEDAAGQNTLLDQLDHLCESGGHVMGILLTHGHADHMGAAARLRDRYDAPIMAHPDVNLPFAIDHTLHDGHIIVVGGEVEWRIHCLHTPGHAPGHMCFFEESTRTLIAGDLVSGQGSVVIAHDDGGDVTAYLESLDRMKQVGAKLIVPGHGMPMGNPVETLQAIIDHRLRREEKIRAAYEAGHHSEDALLAAAYEDVEEDRWPIARQSLRAHLARLGMRVE